MIRSHKRKYNSNLNELLNEIKEDIKNNFKDLEEIFKENINLYNNSLDEKKYLILNDSEQIETFYKTILLKYWNKYIKNMDILFLNEEEIKDYLISFEEYKNLWDNIYKTNKIKHYSEMDQNANFMLPNINISLNNYVLNKNI